MGKPCHESGNCLLASLAMFPLGPPRGGQAKPAHPVSALPLFLVDAFTAEPFKGNPAAVCVHDRPLADGVLQAIAREMNCSETAFVQLADGAQGAGPLPLRWFTPITEMPICGHATLATAKVLFDTFLPGRETLAFATRSGLLTVAREGPALAMDFPADRVVPVPVHAALAEALGAPAIVAAFRGEATGKWVFRLSSEAEVRGLRPDFAALGRLEVPGLRGLGVTAPGHGSCDCVSRYFNPWAGVDEDPVTGSVHTLLAPYWCQELGKEHLLACQASARGGEILLRLEPERERVILAGQAVVLLRGQLQLPEGSRD